MKSQHYLVPAIELHFQSIDEWESAGGQLEYKKEQGELEHYRQGWQSYWSKQRVRSRDTALPGWMSVASLMPVSEISDTIIGEVVLRHKHDLDYEDLTAFFGGYVLTENSHAILRPQCCGTLGDILSWKKLIAEDVTNQYICPEGHPNPEVVVEANTLTFSCYDEYEKFWEPAPDKYRLTKNELEVAVHRAEKELLEFASKVDHWGKLNGISNLSQTLVYQSDYD